ncbi:MAG: hypothetical protein JWN04_2812 [Myxococcaceae bacterium]|nr:hypothetical protein [Myxococcaceae bacterium]
MHGRTRSVLMLALSCSLACAAQSAKPAGLQERTTAPKFEEPNYRGLTLEQLVSTFGRLGIHVPEQGAKFDTSLAIRPRDDAAQREIVRQLENWCLANKHSVLEHPPGGDCEGEEPNVGCFARSITRSMGPHDRVLDVACAAERHEVPADGRGQARLPLDFGMMSVKNETGNLVTFYGRPQLEVFLRRAGRSVALREVKLAPGSELAKRAAQTADAKPQRDSPPSAGEQRAADARIAIDSARVAERYERECNVDDARSCNALGLMYLESTHLPHDTVRAVSLFDRACERGHAAACTNLAHMIERGEGAAKDLARAAALYTKGCNGGNAPGCAGLGVLASRGLGVPKDEVRAVALFKQSCSESEVIGCALLATAYANGQGVAKDEARAAALYEHACDGGNAGGCYGLGTRYEQGRGVERDVSRASQLYAHACSLGMPEACAELGVMYSNGRGVAQDKAQAARLFKQGCDGGFAMSCSLLGGM